MIVGRGNDEQPVDAPLAEEVDELRLALGLPVRARGDHQEADARARSPRLRGRSWSRTDWRRPRSRGRACASAGRAEASARRRCDGSRAARSPRCTSAAVSGRTPGSLLTTRETVLRLTPAATATSLIVGRVRTFAPWRGDSVVIVAPRALYAATRTAPVIIPTTDSRLDVRRLERRDRPARAAAP